MGKTAPIAYKWKSFFSLLNLRGVTMLRLKLKDTRVLFFRAALFAATVAFGSSTAYAIDVPATYDVDKTAFKAAVLGTSLTFTLYTDSACTISAGADTVLVEDVDVLLEPVKLNKVKGGPKPPKIVRLRHTVSGVTAAAELFLKVTGTGITPQGGECQAQGPGGGGTSTAGSTIPFSSGIVLSGATVVSAAPILMGFGESTVETINGSGESTMPPEAGGFAFPVPFDGTIQNLQVSADLMAASVSSINVIPLTYDFTVFRAPSTPNNGIAHVASGYVTTPLSSSVTFGGAGTLVAGTFYAATNMSAGPLVVNAGDRIGIRVRTQPSSDPAAADITQLSFSATLTYTPN
jgi:hypothetical protein